MVYRGGLENRFGLTPDGGSNPSLSAIPKAFGAAVPNTAKREKAGVEWRKMDKRCEPRLGKPENLSVNVSE